MLRLVLLLFFAVVATSAAPAAESDTEFCAGETECPPDCSYVSRNADCVFCQCGPSKLQEGEIIVNTAKGCPPGTVVNQQLGETQTCLPGGPGLPVPDTGCPHGEAFIDECGNDCSCIDGKFYGCTRKLCMPGQTPEKPMSCDSSTELPERKNRRVICDGNIVKVVDEAKPGCRYGDAFIDECGNQCNCQNGEFYGCTFKACASDQQRPQVPMTCTGPGDLPQLSGSRAVCLQGIVRVQQKDEPCIPGSEYMDECNTCTCTDSDQGPFPACTFKACLPQLRGAGCKYGSAYIDECGNDCNCVDDMFYACSKRGCPEGKTAEKPLSCEGPRDLPTRPNRRVVCHQQIVKVQLKDDECLPDSSFMDDCNSCFCSDTGAAGCTLIGCPGLGQPKQACPHGDEFVDECGNACLCVNDEHYGCTFKACKEGERPQSPMKCEGAKDLPEVPNKRVVCHQGIVKLQGLDDKCLTNSSYYDDCNQCFCNDFGVAGCTRKFCLKELPPPESSGCPHGDNFIDECNNDCSCVGDRYDCTRKGCKPGERSGQPMSCSSGRNLPKRPGNTVFCHDNKVKFQDADEKCVPGSSFMMDCNQCTCGPAGVAGCTFKLCL